MTKVRYPKPLKTKYLRKRTDVEASVPQSSTNLSDCLSSNVEVNERTIRSAFEKCSDLVYRGIKSGNHLKVLIVYIDGLLDTKHLEETVVKPLLSLLRSRSEVTIDALLDDSQEVLPIADSTVAVKIEEVVTAVLKGKVLFLVDGESRALMASMEGWSKRSIEEPNTEQVIRGPREGFIETLRVNTALMRRKIRSNQFKIETATIGKYTQTDVAMLYIEGIATDLVLSEVRQRIQRIEIDGVLESAYIEEFIEDKPYSPFPTIQNTERPDIVAASLLEGKVAVLVDGSPFALVMPMTFWAGLQANEDYYERAFLSTAIRFIRLIFFLVALMLPSIYVALVSFQQEMLPTPFLLSIAASQDGTPFPAIIEAFGMEFMFEGLREAGVRLPKAVGSAISIVGALVIGQSAVQAGIVSAPMVIVVATTGIASFIIPRYNLGTAIRMLRFPMLLMAGLFGFYGITIGLLLILVHLVTLRSFGVPYFSPVAPLNTAGLKDTLLRSSLWSLNHRPPTAKGQERRRIPPGQAPSPRKG